MRQLLAAGDDVLTSQVPTKFVLLVAGSLVVLWLVAKKFGPDLRRLFRFLDAWEGYIGPDGNRVPGVLERLTGVEVTAAQAASASAAATEGVQHLSDQVAEIDRKVDEVAAEQTRVRSAVEDLRSTGMDANPTDQTGSTS